MAETETTPVEDGWFEQSDRLDALAREVQELTREGEGGEAREAAIAARASIEEYYGTMRLARVARALRTDRVRRTPLQRLLFRVRVAARPIVATLLVLAGSSVAI